MLYCSRDIARDRCNCYFFILDYFLPFYPPNRLKTENLKKLKKKKHLDISSFYTIVLKTMIIWYTVYEIRRVTNVIVVFHLGLFFVLLPPNSPENNNFRKMKKDLEISSFYASVPKIMIIAILFLRYGAWQM